MNFKLISKKTIGMYLILVLVIAIAQFILIPNSVMAATIVLPTGSTQTELQEAINNAVDDDIIELSNDIALSSALTVSDKDLTIRSNGTTIYTLSLSSDVRHLLIQNGSNLVLESILIYGRTPGGGLAIDTSSSATVSTGASIMNCNNELGGAVYCEGRINITGGGALRNNTATHGGAIYTTNTSYANIVTDSATIFQGNQASVQSTPPENASTLYPSIQFASTSVANHPLNNYDINYLNQTTTVNITYDANGGTGSYVGPDTETGGTNTILSIADTEISRNGYTFTGWNTAPDGSGASYSPGDVITLDGNITLYAQWEQNNVNHYWILLVLLLFLAMALIYVLMIKPRKKIC